MTANNLEWEKFKKESGYERIHCLLHIDGNMYKPSFCPGYDEQSFDCHIVLIGPVSCGYIFTMHGPKPLSTQRYRCHLHGHSFTMFEKSIAQEAHAEGAIPHANGKPYALTQHDQTYVDGDFLFWLVTMYCNRVTFHQIIEIVQDMWVGIHNERMASFAVQNPNTSLPKDVPFWVDTNGHGLFTDRRKLQCLIFDYFQNFMIKQFHHDIFLVRKFFSYGISIDETYKQALKAKLLDGTDGSDNGGDDVAVPDVKRRKITYAAASPCLQTACSCVCGLIVGVQFVASKAASDRKELLQKIFMSQLDGGVRTCYVASDSPKPDTSLVSSVASVTFGAEHIITLGDDLWHAEDRVIKHLSAPLKLRAAPSFKKIFNIIYRRKSRCYHDEVAAECRIDALQPAPTGDGWDDWSIKIAVVQLVAIAFFCVGLSIWGDEYDADLNSAAKIALRNLKSTSKYLFSFLPHNHMLQYYGTTSNENLHFFLNRKSKFTTHQRPDHVVKNLDFCIFLYNSNAVKHALKHALNLTPTQKDMLKGMFVKPRSVPWADASIAPWVMSVSKEYRTYGAVEFAVDFGFPPSL